MDFLSGFEDDLFTGDVVKKPTEQTFEVQLKECGWFLSPGSDLESSDSSNVYKHVADYHFMKKQYAISITNYEKQLSHLLYDSSARRECLENLIVCCTRVGDFSNGRKYAECLVKASKTVEHLTSTLSCLLNLTLMENDHVNSVLHCIRLITLNKYNAYFWSKLGLVISQLVGMKNLSVNVSSKTTSCTVKDSSITVEYSSSTVKEDFSIMTDGSSTVKDHSSTVEFGSSNVKHDSGTEKDSSSIVEEGSQEVDLFSLSSEVKVNILTFSLFMCKFILESSKASSIGLSLEDGEYQRNIISQDLDVLKRRIGEEVFLAIATIARDYVYGSLRDCEGDESSESKAKKEDTENKSSESKGRKEDEETTSWIMSYGWQEFSNQWFKEILLM